MVLTLLFCELAIRLLDLGPSVEQLRLGNHRPSENPVLQYELLPGSGDGRNAISRDGLRDRDFERRKPAGTFRIAIVGDSITYGYGYPREQSYAKRLETLLQSGRSEGAPDVEVLNFGVVGYNIAQVVERLRVSALSFEPDLVVYGYSLNDPQAFSAQAHRLGELSASTADRGRAAGWLARSRLFQIGLQVWSSRGPRDAVARDPLLRDPAWLALFAGDRQGQYFRSLHGRGTPRERLQRGMDDLAQLARQRGIPVVVTVFPLFLDDAVSYPLADIHASVVRQARRRGLLALDLAPAYTLVRAALGEEVARDAMHPNALGHRVAAVAVLRFLDAEGLLPPLSRRLARLPAETGLDADLDALMAEAGFPAAPE